MHPFDVQGEQVATHSVRHRIEQPIFIVGMPRSGTTILYEKLARHPDLACLTTSSRKFPRSVALSKLWGMARRNARPTEAPHVWRRATRVEDDSLSADDATPALRAYYTDVVVAQLRIAGKPRFLSKYPRNGLRMGFFSAIFPDCLFIHIIRDGRAVVRSILEKRETHGGMNAYWGIRPPGWRSLLGLDPVEAVAAQYTGSVDLMRRHGAGMGPRRYMEMRYEDFCSNPVKALADIAGFCSLKWPPELLRKLGAGVRSSNSKWREQFSPAQIETLNRKLEPLLRELGYEV
jgi:hypothetical protein